MKSSEICALAIQIVNWEYGKVMYRRDNTTTDYGQYYNALSWFNDAWHADCLGFLRAVLCGWNADKTVMAGGADTSYGCYTKNYGFTESAFLDSCTSTSQDFTQLAAHPCSLLYKPGHVGLYVGEYQIDGKIYNSCECTTSFGWGGRPTWVDPDGLRRRYQGANAPGDTAGYWTDWGIFNLDGVDYGITEYDGGATGATGFGSQLTQEEVEHYWDLIGDPTYDTLEALAESLYEMPADIFACEAGYVYGEYPTGFDEFMMYLCSCIPINFFMAWGGTTPQAMSTLLGGTDPGSYYSVANLNSRAAAMKVDTTTAGIRTRKAIYLALLNPNQYVTECVGTPLYPPDGPPASRRIYTQYNLPNGQLEQWALRSAYGDRTYDITGTGIRGGNPPTPSKNYRNLPIYMWLRPYQNIYRRKKLWF